MNPLHVKIYQLRTSNTVCFTINERLPEYMINNLQAHFYNIDHRLDDEQINQLKEYVGLYLNAEIESGNIVYQKEKNAYIHAAISPEKSSFKIKYPKIVKHEADVKVNNPNR